MIPSKTRMTRMVCQNCQKSEVILGNHQEAYKRLGRDRNQWVLVQLDRDGGDSVRILLACGDCWEVLHLGRDYLCCDVVPPVEFFKHYVEEVV